MEELDKYLQRTGQDESEISGGLSFFGTKKVLELIAEANQLSKKLVFYYASDKDLQSDILSYRFE